MIQDIISGFQIFFHLEVIIALIVGVMGGMVVGILPGLGGTMAIAVLLPVTFGMSPITAIGMLVGIYKASTHAGSISAILIHTPGTAAAAATVNDGYSLAQQGKALKALDHDLFASVTGSTLSSLALVVIAFPLASLALMFGAPERFGILVFALTIIGGVSGTNLVKGIMSGLFGLFLSTVGMDPIYGTTRFAFGIFQLRGGIDFIAMLIGMYALSEILIQCEGGIKRLNKREEVKVELKSGRGRGTFKEYVTLLPTIIRSTLYGIGIGALPGVGAAVGAFMAYSQAWYKSKTPDKFGKGSLEGLVAAESGNNGVTGAAFIPTLTLGIPGDITMALMLGALMIQGITPGPALFEDNAPMVYAIFMSLFACCLILLVIGYFTIPILTKIVSIPKSYLYPVIVMLAIVGCYAVNVRGFEIYVMLFGGMLGYVMRKFDFPLAPINIAFILGPMVETSLRHSLVMGKGSLAIFVTRPIALFFILLALFSLVMIYKRIDKIKSLRAKIQQ